MCELKYGLLAQSMKIQNEAKEEKITPRLVTISGGLAIKLGRNALSVL